MDAIAEVAVARDWIAVIAERFSIEIDEHRQTAFLAAIQSYATTLGESMDSLLARADRRNLSCDEWARILHLATNHETRFFRYQPVVDLIKQLAAGNPCPRVLSVGCSSGEEPYSLATALLRAGHAKFSVHGTDVSEVCIETAQKGEYPPHPEIGHDVAAPIANGKVRFHMWFRLYLTFEAHNIMSPRPIDFPNPDIIVTQNMLIYYKVQTRHEILAKLGAMLPRGGYLITGPAEDAGWSSSSLERIQHPAASLFRKV